MSNQIYLASGVGEGKPIALKLIDDDGSGIDALVVRQYQVQWLAEFLHSFPHVNLSFAIINPTFDPYNTSYQESLMFLASLPVVWMLLTMLVFIVYFCYMCYHTGDGDKKAKSSKCLRWTIAVFVILSCGCAGFGIFGNEEVSRGMKTFTDHAASETSDWENTIDSVKTTVSGIEGAINKSETRGVTRLKDVFNRASSSFNNTVVKALTKFTDDASTTLNAVKEKVNSIQSDVIRIPDVTSKIKRTREYEFYRWIGTLVLLCFFLLVCLIFLAAVATGSKCLIIFCTCLGVFCLILSWTVIGIYLASAVAVGDFCVDPNGFVQREASGKVNPEVLYYYMNCTTVNSPFSADLKAAHDGMAHVDGVVRDLDKYLNPFMKDLPNKKVRNAMKVLRKGVNRSVRYIQRLTSLVSCFSLHESYVSALEGICHTGLGGIAFLLLSNLAVAILVTIVIVLASVLWRRLGESSSTGNIDEGGSYKTRRHEVGARREFTWHFPPPDHGGHNGDLYNRKSYSTIDADDDAVVARPQNSPSYHRYGSLNDVVSAYPSYAAHHASPDQSSPWEMRPVSDAEDVSGGRFSPPSLRMPGSTRHTGPEHLPLQGTQTPPPAFEAKDPTTLQYGDYYEEYHHPGMSSTLGSRSGRRDPNGPVQV